MADRQVRLTEPNWRFCNDIATHTGVPITKVANVAINAILLEILHKYQEHVLDPNYPESFFAVEVLQDLIGRQIDMAGTPNGMFAYLTETD